jgi:hypothetical protein
MTSAFGGRSFGGLSSSASSSAGDDVEALEELADLVFAEELSGFEDETAVLFRLKSKVALSSRVCSIGDRVSRVLLPLISSCSSSLTPVSYLLGSRSRSSNIISGLPMRLEKSPCGREDGTESLLRETRLDHEGNVGGTTGCNCINVSKAEACSFGVCELALNFLELILYPPAMRV